MYFEISFVLKVRQRVCLGGAIATIYAIFRLPRWWVRLWAKPLPSIWTLANDYDTILVHVGGGPVLNSGSERSLSC